MMNPRISVNPTVHSGKPCVAGTRITVEAVMELVESGCGFEQITRDYYPDLTVDDLRACIQFVRQILASEQISVATA
jgi:uncharacterized protein (DUF433 family)